MTGAEWKCPYCGAGLEKPETGSSVCCPYCGMRVELPRTAGAEETAEEAGYRFEKGRQRAWAEALEGTEKPQEPRQPEKTETRQPRSRTWLWVLGWIFLFPVPLGIVLRQKTALPLWARVLILVGAWSFYLLLGIGGGAAQ